MTPSTAQSPVVRSVSADARAAANDNTVAASPPVMQNPLWIIVIGMAWFFAVAAAVMALG